MRPIKLYNTANRRLEAFEPADERAVGMYACGPTVYDRAHLGNARSAVVFDTLFRLLRHRYGPEHVTFVRNITDVDDKINARAAETGRAIAEITDETARWYREDMAALGVMEPTHQPHATAFIPQMVTMIERLVDRGHAYAAEGHVLFSVASYAEYGALSGRSVEDMIAGARVEVAPYKRDPMDFVLWKPSAPDLPGWDSPWGRGRPGWHIECSAMSRALLGETFDIHGGGADLAFPHHENEIAQSHCANNAPMARYWIHNEMLQIEGRKMSKSLGNFFTVRDLLDRGVPGEVIRFVLLGTHYRKPLDWTEARVAEARRTLKTWFSATDGVTAEPVEPGPLAQDLNVPGLFAEMHGMLARNEPGRLRGSMALLGFPAAEQVEWFRSGSGMSGVANRMDTTDLGPLLEHWQSLRHQRRYQDADALKAAIEACGVKLSVGAAGPDADVQDGFDQAGLRSLREREVGAVS